MSPMSSPFAFVFCFVLLVSSSRAFNITKILDKHSDFTDFENLLTRTGLAKDINNMQTVTVLVVSNGNTAVLSGMSDAVIKRVLSVHIILDYYDEQKLKKLQSKQPKTLTTFYQQSGEAQNRVGFLNMTNTGKSATVFKSANPNNDVEANLVKEVETHPYDISVLEISNILNVASSIAKSPTASHSQSPKASRRPRKALAPAPVPDLAPADGPSDDHDSVPPSKPNTIEGDADAPGPLAPAPAPAPGMSSDVAVLYGDYLLSTVLMMLTCAWSLLAMV